ncbi:MAG: adenylate cyclase [Myxococcota bacterium]|jgi:adenylate cyclase
MADTSRRSFRLVISLLFVTQVSVAVALTWGIAWFNGQRSAQDMAALLREEYSTRIQDNLTAYLATPEQVVRFNAAAVTPEQLTDFDALQRQLFHQLRTFSDIGYLYYGDQTGSYVGLDRAEDDRFRLQTTDGSGDGISYAWAVTETGGRGALEETGPAYDPRMRPWYQAATSIGTLTWTDTYVWFSGTDLCLDAVFPVVGMDGSVVGVFGAGFTLSHINRYLQGLSIGRSGKAFIVERTGSIVASSADDPIIVLPGGVTERVEAVSSRDALARAAARHLDAMDSALITATIDEVFQVDEHGPVHLQITPFSPASGLDWLIVVAVPERDFMAHIEANNRHTLLLILVALLAANLVGIQTVRWLGRPLLELAGKAQRIRGGDLSVTFVSQAQDEIGILSQAMGEMVDGLREREHIRDAFGRYVHPRLVEEVLSNPDGLKPGGHLQPVTILMSDLRGFSELTARLEPVEMVSLLNRYLGEMTAVIHDHGGMVNEFIGDAILALFGAPATAEDDALRAVHCAVHMQNALADLNVALSAEGIDALEMGIGLSSGEVVVGNIGSEQRVKYGVIGDAVNLAARIESLTLGTQVLINDTTAELLDESVVLGPWIEATVKGRTEALRIRAVLGLAGESPMPVAPTTLRAVTLSCTVNRMSGKQVVEPGEAVEILQLGATGLELRGMALTRFDNVRLSLPLPDGPTAPLYGKVTRTWEMEGVAAAAVAFTWVDPADRGRLG